MTAVIKLTCRDKCHIDGHAITLNAVKLFHTEMESSFEHGLLWQALTNPYPNKPSSNNKYLSLYTENSNNLEQFQKKPLKNEQREKYNARRRISALTEEQREKKRVAQRVISLTEEQRERRNARRRVIALNAEQLRKKRNRHKSIVLTEQQRMYRNARRREYVMRKQMQNNLRLKQSKRREDDSQKLTETQGAKEELFQIGKESKDNAGKFPKRASVSQNCENSECSFVNNGDVVKCENSLPVNSSFEPICETLSQHENINSFSDSEKCEENLCTKTENTNENPLENCYEQNEWKNWVFNEPSEE